MIIHDLKFLEQAAKNFSKTENIARVLFLIKSGNPFDQLFFQRLADPAWLPILKASGIFSNLPYGENNDDGTVTYPRSTALRGLMNLSKVRPKEVIEIIEEIVIPLNPSIKDQMMAILAEIDDPTVTNRILCLTSKIILAEPYSNLVWIEQILGKSLKHQFYNEVLHVVSSIIDVTLSAIEKNPKIVDTWQIGEIDKNIVAPISEVIPLQVCQIIFPAFVRWTEIERKRERESSNKYLEAVLGDSNYLNEENSPSSYWLSDFHGSVIGSHDIEAIFAYRLFSIGAQLLKKENYDEYQKFDQALRSNPWNLFARLRWQLYADFPSLTLKEARFDTLERLQNLGQYTEFHGYEFAQLLQVHAETNGNNFLNAEEVERLIKIISLGPICENGERENDDQSAKSFQFKQIYPIKRLLTSEQLDWFQSIEPDSHIIDVKSYKPFSSGEARFIESVAPSAADHFPSMTDIELWNFLNTWIPEQKNPDPSKWWIEQDVNALGKKFAEYVDQDKVRFQNETHWWENIDRPVILSKVLDQAMVQLSELKNSSQQSSASVTANDWGNWFGVCQRITELAQQSGNARNIAKNENPHSDQDRHWPCMVVIRFIQMALNGNPPIREDLARKSSRILKELISKTDERLENVIQPSMGDWQSTAINSVRGSAVECLLDYARFCKSNLGNQEVENWIFPFLRERLSERSESPAVFAILGSKLRLFTFLFSDNIKVNADLLLPGPTVEHRNAFLLAHFRYDNPMPLILECFPEFTRYALDCLNAVNNETQKELPPRGDFGARIGTHLGFYYWNQSYPSNEIAAETMDRYFLTASANQRSAFIRDVANIFSNVDASSIQAQLIINTTEIWDRRYEQINQMIQAEKLTWKAVQPELSSFINWIGCECFPFDWRYSRTRQAIAHLETTPNMHGVLKLLESYSSDDTRLQASIRILHDLLSKEVRQDIWSFREDSIKAILSRGLSSQNSENVELATQTQEKLLHLGLFEYLDIKIN